MSDGLQGLIVTLPDGSKVVCGDEVYMPEPWLSEEERRRIESPLTRRLGLWFHNFCDDAVDEGVAQYYLVTAAPGLDLKTTDMKDKVMPEVRKLVDTFFEELINIYVNIDHYFQLLGTLTRGPFEQAVEFLNREPYYSTLLDKRHSCDGNGEKKEDGEEEMEEEAEDDSSSSSWDRSSTASSMDLSYHQCPTCGSTDLFCQSNGGKFVNNSDSAVVIESDFGGNLRNAPWDALLCEICHEEVEDRRQRDPYCPFSLHDEDGNPNPETFHRLWSEPDNCNTFTNVGGAQQRYMIAIWQFLRREYRISHGFSMYELEDEEKYKLATINFSGAIKQALDSFIIKSLGRLILKDLTRFAKEPEDDKGAECEKLLKTEDDKDEAVPSEREKQLEAEVTRLQRELAEAKQQSARAKRKGDDVQAL